MGSLLPFKIVFSTASIFRKRSKQNNDNSFNRKVNFHDNRSRPWSFVVGHPVYTGETDKNISR